MVASLEDWCHWLMLLAAGHNGRCLRAPLFEHRRHGHTMTHYAQSRRRLSHRKLRQHSPSLYEIETLSALKARWRLAVSVVTPYYNSGEYIDETLAALQRQTTYDFEWIIVDDGSTDEAAIAKLKAIEADRSSYPFPIAVCWRSHQGAPAARNFGALQARGEYLFMLDSDDLIAPTALEKLVLFAQFQPSRRYVYSCVRHFGEITGTACDPFRRRTAEARKLPRYILPYPARLVSRRSAGSTRRCSIPTRTTICGCACSPRDTKAPCCPSRCSAIAGAQPATAPNSPGRSPMRK